MSGPHHVPSFKGPLPAEPNSRPLPVQPGRPPDPLVRLWGGWLRLTGPRKGAFGASLAAQEQLRRARLISALLVLVVITIGIIVPSAPANPRNWIPVVILTCLALLVALLNRWGATTLSAAFYVAMVDTAIVGFLLVRPTLSTGNLPDLDLLLLAVLVAGMILPRWLILVTGAVQVVLIISIFQVKPLDPLLIEQIVTQQAGQAYTALVAPLVLQACGVGIAWLHAWSVERALVRADRAEELAAAEGRIADQTRLILEQKARLEEGIVQILETHRQVAAGNVVVRVPIPEQHELWQIGWALNNLLGRFQRQMQQNQELVQTCDEIEALTQALEAGRTGQRFTYPHCRTPLGYRLIQVLRS